MLTCVSFHRHMVHIYPSPHLSATTETGWQTALKPRQYRWLQAVLRTYTHRFPVAEDTQPGHRCTQAPRWRHSWFLCLSLSLSLCLCLSISLSRCLSLLLSLRQTLLPCSPYLSMCTRNLFSIMSLTPYQYETLPYQLSLTHKCNNPVFAGVHFNQSK